MSTSSNSLKWVSVILAVTTAIFLFLWLKEKQQSPVTPTNDSSGKLPDSVIASKLQTSAEEWGNLQSLADSFQKKIEATSKAREEKNVTITSIDEAIGDVYLRSYRNAMGAAGANNTKAIILKLDEIAFIYNYLNVSGDTEIQLSLGRYDRALLTSSGLTDTEFQKPENTGKDQRFTLVLGLPINPRPNSSAIKYMNPFIIGSKRVYLDWHDLWP